MKFTEVKIGNPEAIKNENNYSAEAIEDGDKYYYRVEGVTIEIPKSEYQAVIANPKLYYFSTALKLHLKIRQERQRIARAKDREQPSLQPTSGPPFLLPPRPDGFKGTFTQFGSKRPARCPKNMPPSAIPVGSVEWSWSPAHDREDRYRLSTNRARSHWILWIGYYDDMDNKWAYYPYAYGPRKKVAAKTAAIYLLIDGWRQEPQFDSNPGPFHGIGAEGLLKSTELNAMKAAVWQSGSDMKEKKRKKSFDLADACGEQVLKEILGKGNQVAWQDWDSGGPGAGAGRVSVYQYKNMFYVLNDAGINGPFPSKQEAIESSGVQIVNDTSLAIWDADVGYIYRRQR